MIEYGSIEVIRGDESVGKTFGPDDAFDEEDAEGSVSRLVGVTLNALQPWDGIAPDAAVGQWDGTDENGENVTVRVWTLDPD